MALNFKNISTKIGKKLSEHAPELLVGTGLGLWIISSVKAVKVTPKAYQKIEDKKQELNTDQLTIKETLQTVGKDYIWPVTGAIIGSGCIIASVTTSGHRYMVLSSAYQFIDDSFQTYKAKTIETIGKKKAEEIQGKVAEERLSKQDSNQVIITGKGKNLCFDSFSGRYFEFDIGKIGEVENNINYQIVHFNYISLNEMFCMFGLEPIDCGYELGWSIDTVPHKDLFAFEKSSKLTKEGEPCLVLDYNVPPSSKYDVFA